MFTNLPAHERSAFFNLLDEYFTSRPHYLPSASSSSSSATPTSTSSSSRPAAAPPGGVTLTASDLQKVGRIGRGLMAGAAQTPPAPPARGATGTPAAGGAPPPAGANSGFTSSKAFGKISTASASAALGSVLGNRGKPAQAAPVNPTPASQPLPPPRLGAAAASLPPPTRSVGGAGAVNAPAYKEPAAVEKEEEEGLGWAKALYDYAGTSASDLSVSEGEEIYLVKVLTGGEWYEARSADGQRQGMVPCNYVERI